MKRATMTDTTASLSVTAHAAAPTAIRIGDVFGRSLKLFAAHWGAYCGMMTLGNAFIVILTGALATRLLIAMERDKTIALVIAFTFYAAYGLCLSLASAAVSFGVAQEIGGRRFSFGRSLGVMLTRSPAILALALLIGLYGIFALAFLIVPGALVFSVYLVAIPACIVEGLGPLRSMSRSAFLTKGNRWRVFGIFCTLCGGGVAIEGLVSFILEHIANPVVGIAIWLVFNIVLEAFGGVVVGVLYAQLRAAREGVGIDHIAAVFD
jgi:hypothetical protein